MKKKLTYYNNKTLGAVDVTIEEANKEINNKTDESMLKYLQGLVVGEFTFQDAINQEIKFHRKIKENCEHYGFGNSRRLAIHILKILEEIKNRHNAEYEKGSPLAPAQQTETKAEQETPETFESLFYNKNLVNPCINILKEIEPPLIDNDCNFLGSAKSGILIWIDEMRRQAVIKKGYPQERKLLALLIPLKIKGFVIDESMFSKNSVRAERQYRTDIKAMVSEIKLSQNSQTES